jgi:hypothetical protein
MAKTGAPKSFCQFGKAFSSILSAVAECITLTPADGRNQARRLRLLLPSPAFSTALPVRVS